jgi:hypothetical protein
LINLEEVAPAPDSDEAQFISVMIQGEVFTDADKHTIVLNAWPLRKVLYCCKIEMPGQKYKFAFHVEFGPGYCKRFIPRT